MRKQSFANKILIVICISLLIILQMGFTLPSFAEKAGDVLIVRVQYFGESGNKIREKVRFTREELEAMGSETHYYSNVTSVGTVMGLSARGPKVLTIIEKAGIDTNSVQSFTFKTIDGYTRNFTIPDHLTSTKYYYPNLSSKYERDDDNNMTLLEGATKGKVQVPAILALECGESKMPGRHAEDIAMTTTKAYRFCMGQSELHDGEEVDLKKNVSSIDSCHSIYGIDVTLYGSPEDSDDVDIKDDKVGSKKKSSGNKNTAKKANKAEKKVYIKTREIVLGDKIVEDISPQERLRNNMGVQAKALNDVEPYSKGAGIAVGIGTGALFGLGLIARLIKFRKRF